MKGYKNSFNSKEEALAFCKTLPIDSLLNMCAELLIAYQPQKKITITQEQFNTFFRIVGVREDGTAENRGRGRKKVEDGNGLFGE